MISDGYGNKFTVYCSYLFPAFKLTVIKFGTFKILWVHINLRFQSKRQTETKVHGWNSKRDRRKVDSCKVSANDKRQ